MRPATLGYNPGVRIRLLAFASAREALGAPQLEVELPDGSRLADLRRVLVGDHRDLETLWPRLAVAVDGELERNDPALADGQEVALLPPVSGGSEPSVALVDGPLDAAVAIDGVRSARRGAVAVFLGTVRGHHAGRAVERLTYEAYRPMALSALRRIADDLESADGDLAVAIHHRLGEVPVGDTSVVIATAAPHRAAAFAASREALERLKREVPIWKREHYADGATVWREEESLASPGRTPPAGAQ
jgi:MoaE-MoaD fusion protein